MKICKIILCSALVAVLFCSCNNDTDNNTPLGSYDDGILVLNEGGADTGFITYISNDLSTVQQDIFTLVNGSETSLGGYLQSVFFEGNRAFIISSLSNKITVVNRYTFEYIATIATGFSNPRYGAVFNGKAYVTNMNDFNEATDDFITVINLGDFSVDAPISVGYNAEKLIASNGKLYVSGGAFGMGNKITVIDTQSETIDTAITVGEAPNSMEIKDGILYVLCSSFSQTSEIVKIDLTLNTVVAEIIFPSTMNNAMNLDLEGDYIYFTVGAKAYKHNIIATAVQDTPLFDTQSASSYIGYGFAVRGNRIFMSEAADDFVSDGRIFIYSDSGTFIDEVAAGLGPNGFYFND